MFKKISKLENQVEKVEIFNILKFSLTTFRILAELLWLGLLIAGIGELIIAAVADIIYFGDFIALGLMLATLGLIRLPCLYAKSTLHADFGQDVRSRLKRLNQIITMELRRGLFIWLVSCLLFFSLINLSLWYWLASIFGLGLIAVSAIAFYPKLWWSYKLRPLQEGDISPSTLGFLPRWEEKSGIKKEKIVISTSFTAELHPPYLLGLKPFQRLVLPEKALSSFTPREIDLLLAMTMLGAIIKVPNKIYFLYLCSVSIVVPLAVILVNTLGVTLWFYPEVTSPLIITLVWLGAWLGLQLANFSTRLINRTLGPQLAAAASLFLKDNATIAKTCATLAKYNLEDETPPGWQEIFRPRFTAKVFIKQANYHQHLAKFEGQKE